MCRTWIAGFLFAGILVLTGLSTARAVEFPQYGFQIDALDAASSAEATGQALMMFLPASEGFAPNVNVQIQPYKGTMKDYIALSKKQFEQLHMKMISERQNGNTEWLVEYSGALQGSTEQLHWYAKAIESKQKIYLATATASEAQWSKLADRLRKNVDSFKLK